MLYKSSFSLFIFFLATSISSAHVKLEYPNGGESFTPGSEITIKWSIAVDHGDNNWDLFYSLDAGANWHEIEIDIDKSILEHTWKIPITETTSAKVKVVQDNDDYPDYDDISTNFSISNDALPPDPEPEVITGIEEFNFDSEKEMALSSFPNPFTSHTTIQFSLFEKSHVSLNVYNLQGRLVSELVNGQLLSGTHKKTWKPVLSEGRNDGFSGGTYLVNLIVNDQIFTRKILLNQ